MRLTSTCAIAASVWLALTGASLAQGVTSQEIQVNPLPPGGGVLLYPGGEYSRRVPQLLYPGQNAGPIHLHMSTHHHAVSEAAAPRPKRVASAPPPAPKPKPKPKELASAAPRPAPESSSASPFGGAADLSHVFGGSAPPPVKTAPAGPVTGNENLTKRSVILFAKDAPDPAQGALGSIKFLAGALNAAMVSPNARVELEAFGGVKGDKGSDAHRLALKRALAIRQVLIDDGVAPDRIDVHANGGVEDSGPADRVDVYVKA